MNSKRFDEFCEEERKRTNKLNKRNAKKEKKMHKKMMKAVSKNRESKASESSISELTSEVGDSVQQKLVEAEDSTVANKSTGK